MVDKLLNHTLAATGNQANSVVSAVAEVYILSIFLPKAQAAIDAWEAKLSTILRPPYFFRGYGIRNVRRIGREGPMDKDQLMILAAVIRKGSRVRTFRHVGRSVAALLPEG